MCGYFCLTLFLVSFYDHTNNLNNWGFCLNIADGVELEHRVCVCVCARLCVLSGCGGCPEYVSCCLLFTPSLKLSKCIRREKSRGTQKLTESKLMGTSAEKIVLE